MKFVYTAEGADPKSWPFNPKKLMNAEAEAIERQTGMTFSEWEDRVTRGSITATHALLWVLLKRDVPTLKYDEVVFNASEVALLLDDDESAAMLKALGEKAKREGLAEGEQEVYDLLLATAPEPDEEPAEGDEPEAEEAPKD